MISRRRSRYFILTLRTSAVCIVPALHSALVSLCSLRHTFEFLAEGYISLVRSPSKLTDLGVVAIKVESRFTGYSKCL